MTRIFLVCSGLKIVGFLGFVGLFGILQCNVLLTLQPIPLLFLQASTFDSSPTGTTEQTL